MDSSAPPLIAVVGGGGFVGSHCVQRLQRVGQVRPVKAPRLLAHAQTAGDILRQAQSHPSLRHLAESLTNCDVVVNAAGLPTSTAPPSEALTGANAMLPALVAMACQEAGVRRLVHVSSAAVQGRMLLDETWHVAPETPYARSKALGEESLRALGSPGTTCLRPTSVHGVARRVTQRVSRLARGHLAVVASPPTRATPQVHIANVADAIAFVAITTLSVPSVILQPSEGFTTFSFLKTIGEHSPRVLPSGLARGALSLAQATIRHGSSRAGDLRRLEVLLFGQPQSDSWLDSVGWTPPFGLPDWQLMASELRMRDTRRHVAVMR